MTALCPLSAAGVWRCRRTRNNNSDRTRVSPSSVASGERGPPSLRRFVGPIENVTAMEWVNIIVQGVLIGGLYAMFAAGLALIFGVMRLVNIAHGDLIVLAAYIALMTTDTLGLNPLLAIIIVVPI